MYTSSLYSGRPSLTVFHSEHKQKNECSRQWHADSCEFFWNCPLYLQDRCQSIAYNSHGSRHLCPFYWWPYPFIWLVAFQVTFFVVLGECRQCFVALQRRILSFVPGFCPNICHLLDVGWMCGAVEHSICAPVRQLSQPKKVTRLADVDHSVIPCSVVLISSTLTSDLLCHFSTCPPTWQVYLASNIN